MLHKIAGEPLLAWVYQGVRRCSSLDQVVVATDSEEILAFCKEHRSEILGRRLNADRLTFVQTFVFPPSHMELLPVRESKKERAAYEEQMKKEVGMSEDNANGEKDDDWGISA